MTAEDEFHLQSKATNAAAFANRCRGVMYLAIAFAAWAFGSGMLER